MSIRIVQKREKLTKSLRMARRLVRKTPIYDFVRVISAPVE